MSHHTSKSSPAGEIYHSNLRIHSADIVWNMRFWLEELKFWLMFGCHCIQYSVSHSHYLYWSYCNHLCGFNFLKESHCSWICYGWRWAQNVQVHRKRCWSKDSHQWWKGMGCKTVVLTHSLTYNTYISWDHARGENSANIGYWTDSSNILSIVQTHRTWWSQQTRYVEL